MPEVLELKELAEEIIFSYEAKVRSIDTILETTHLILNDFQESILNNKEEGEKINTRLRDTLANNEHLRRKDFDNMMMGILSAQEQREREVKNLLKDYLTQQKEMALTLRDNLTGVKDALAKGEVQRCREFQSIIKQILAGQSRRKQEVVSKLKEFQRQQYELTARLRELLTKGKNLLHRLTNEFFFLIT